MVNQCPKCSGEMERGMLVGWRTEISWRKGGPSMLATALTPGKKKVISFKCKKCGYIENYIEGE